MEEQSDTPYFLSTCAPYSETAAANPMRAYSREDCAEIIAHEGGTAYVLAEDYERELAAATRERDEARALNAQWAEKAATWMASPEAAQRLQGYREVAQQVAKAQNERDEARAIANDRDAMVDHRDRALTAMYQCVDVITQERDEARAKVERLRKVLRRLACLGNGDQYGTSFGNDIAREVLAATEAKP